MSIKAPKTISTTVPKPRANPLGVRRNPRGFLPGPTVKRPRNNTRVYTKDTLREDPSQFYGSGFGDTGMTGDS